MTAKDFDPERALRVLREHDVAFIVIGGIAANALGSPSLTQDLDVCYARDQRNLEALASVLAEIHATLRGAPPDLPFVLDARTLKNGDSFTFDTDFGSVDILGTPKGTDGYADLIARATPVQLFDGVTVHCASLDDLIRMKQAAGRPKDRIELEVLEAVRQERRRQPPA